MERMSVMAVGEKRVKDIDDSFQNASIVLVDIEGTTTSISFVKDTLFPYIRSNLQSYLTAHWNDAEFQQDLLLLMEQAKQDEADKLDGVQLIPEDNKDKTMEAVVKNVLWQMDSDRKTTALKQLQGHIMREGYKNGNLKGHVYSDVVPALKTWSHSGQQIYVYSSGSVEAQKLLFGHSEEGDILELFAGHFDTEVGPKVESDSYRNIVKKLDCRSEDVVFLTDLPREAKAAQEAGLKVVIVVREGNELLTEEDKVNFPVIKSFHDFVFEASAKRQKICTNDDSPASNTPNSPIGQKIEAVGKTEVAIPESACSGNTGSSSDDFEKMDVSSNDAQVTDMKPDKTEIESKGTDNMKMAVGDSHMKESEKVEEQINDTKVPKTESSFSLPESKTVDAADVEKDSQIVCSKNAEECDSKEVSETSVTKLSTEVGVSKVDDDVKANEKDSKSEIINAEAENTEVNIKEISGNGEETSVDAQVVGTNTHDKNVEDRASEDDSREKADLEAVSGDTKHKSVGTGSVSLESESGAMETGSKGGKTDVCKDGSSEVKVDSSNEDANLEEMETDAQNKKTDVNSTKIEERMETGSTEIENVKLMDADVKDKEKIDTGAMAAERKDKIVEEAEMRSPAKLGERDVALKKERYIKSEGTENGKEKGENTEPSANSEVCKESGVNELESEINTKTQSDMILHQPSEKQSVSDSSVDASRSQTENHENASGGNEDPEAAQSTVKSDTKLANTRASPEESKTEQNSKEPKSADKLLQDKTEDISDTVKDEDSKLTTTSDKETAKESADVDEDTKLPESKNEEDNESKIAEDTAKENGLAFAAENGNKCPDTKQNGEVTGKEQDVKVKKLPIDGSGNSGVTKDDDAAAPVGASGSS